ncbi:hypothetical protein PNBC_09500 [Paenibacillus crassostreae]|uniref:Uncharacterized protein n=1 Tax=Paenibacillus crassostreae TaxID=1763538 RepID=A0A167E2J9_9BACL|nr:hypothetical protein LPB68_14435 [Paenibacillus crassostreae]OAB75065.1 hypothetical protein PNBC_09500 [Paenibacillus crassostreae]
MILDVCIATKSIARGIWGELVVLNAANAGGMGTVGDAATAGSTGSTDDSIIKLMTQLVPTTCRFCMF